MIDQIFSRSLLTAGSRLTGKLTRNGIFLDKNEQPCDLEDNIKQQVLDELLKKSWNRYPPADNSNLEELIAMYTGLSPDSIALAPGSAHIITTLLNYFYINQNHIVIAQPSYTLFDYHCKTYGINYEPWLLNKSLEYDVALLPALTEKSVVIIASPNNPVGNSISIEQLETILNHINKPLVILDAVYFEFSNTDYNPLLKKYNNLIILRSFSKAFPLAGIRLGYVCSSELLISIVKKLILMFSINQFTRTCASTILSNPEYLLKMENLVLDIINERDYLYHRLLELAADGGIEIKKSEGNFLLVKIHDTENFNKTLTTFDKKKINVLNTSNLCMLENTIRISIGKPSENNLILNCLKSSIK
jgi:histidinol-phosphate aminotransferase